MVQANFNKTKKQLEDALAAKDQELQRALEAAGALSDDATRPSGEDELAEAQAQIAALQGEVAGATDAAAQARTEKDTLQTAVDTLQRQLVDVQAQHDAVSAKAAASAQALAEAEAQLQTRGAPAAEESQAAQQLQQLQQLQQRHQQAEGEWQEQRQQLSQQVSLLQSQLDTAKAAGSQLAVAASGKASGRGSPVHAAPVATPPPAGTGSGSGVGVGVGAGVSARQDPELGVPPASADRSVRARVIAGSVDSPQVPKTGESSGAAAPLLLDIDENTSGKERKVPLQLHASVLFKRCMNNPVGFVRSPAGCMTVYVLLLHLTLLYAMVLAC